MLTFATVVVAALALLSAIAGGVLAVLSASGGLSEAMTWLDKYSNLWKLGFGTALLLVSLALVAVLSFLTPMEP